MTDQTRDAIKTVREGCNSVTWDEESSRKYREAIHHLITHIENMESVKGELPEKLNTGMVDIGVGSISNPYEEGFNSCLDQVTPLFHQKNERIAELEAKLEAWFTVFGTTQLTHAQDRLEVAERELIKNSVRMSELVEKDKRITELQSDLTAKTLELSKRNLDYNKLFKEAVVQSTKVAELPDRLPEYTDDFNATRGGYSHSTEGKRWFDIEENQGFNNCLDQVIPLFHQKNERIRELKTDLTAKTLELSKRNLDYNKIWNRLCALEKERA